MSKFQDIHPNAVIGNNVKIASFVTIEEDVVIGDNCQIGANVSILNGTRMGEGSRIFPGAIISSIPQDLKFGGEQTLLNIGRNVTIREYCTINRGTAANGSTDIGDNTLIMAYCHVAHDCIIEENCILSNCVNLAGHIEVGRKTVLGGLSAVHQFVRIGDHVMVGGGSLVRKDVPPYVKAAREPLSYAGVNSIGLKRRGFSTDQIDNIRDIYRILYIKGYNTTQALEEIESNISDTPEKSNIIKFIRKADRGIIRGLRSNNLAKANGHRS